MRNIALLIEYDGTGYNGWQIQKNGKSIQEVIEKKLSGLLQESIKVVGAGRTDAGVHAAGQVANFHTHSSWEVDEVVYSLNCILPYDISIIRGAIVPEEFHSRFDAISRKYGYNIITRKSPLTRRFASFSRFFLSVDLMNEAARLLVGKKSFKSFTKYADQQKHFICNVTKAEWKMEAEERHEEDSANSHFLRFEIEANRFLHGMVRAIVGTLMDVGREKITVDSFKTIIEKERRSFASMSAPACGLILEEVKYVFDIWDRGTHMKS